jgi:hypothetical protein
MLGPIYVKKHLMTQPQAISLEAIASSSQKNKKACQEINQVCQGQTSHPYPYAPLFKLN